MFFLFSLFGCLKQNKKSDLDNYLIRNYSEHFIKVPEPNFNKVLGYTPSTEELNLGRMLFNDVILSRNNDVSCATCHLTNHGFATGNRLDFGALGKGGATGENSESVWGEGVLSNSRHCGDDGFGFNCEGPMFRNSLSTINVVYRADPFHDTGLLWDGRFGKLSFQTLLPVHTKEEMCGANPLPLKNKNIFSAQSVLFRTPVLIRHSHAGNRYSGEQFDKFNAKPEEINGVESFRGDKTRSKPLRNECTAIAVAKIRSVKKYRDMFEKVYEEEVSDLNIGKALGAFVSSHVSMNTPYDEYIAGDFSALTERQKIGAAIFLKKDLGKFEVLGREYLGGSCVRCHTPPLFGGSGFASLAVKSDPRSALSKPSLIFDVGQSGFFPTISKQRGDYPRCHVKGQTTTNTYAPDMGRALATYKIDDCFKFRIPSLRNVIETAPYMHHGTFNGQDGDMSSFKRQSYSALKQTVSYHLTGVKNWRKEQSFSTLYKYYDPFFNLDQIIPIDRVDFISPYSAVSENEVYNRSLEALVDFIANALWDKSSTKKGYWGNDVTHPKSVPSGFLPTVTRDEGVQTELPPNFSPIYDKKNK